MNQQGWLKIAMRDAEFKKLQEENEKLKEENAKKDEMLKEALKQVGECKKQLEESQERCVKVVDCWQKDMGKGLLGGYDATISKLATENEKLKEELYDAKSDMTHEALMNECVETVVRHLAHKETLHYCEQVWEGTLDNLNLPPEAGGGDDGDGLIG